MTWFYIKEILQTQAFDVLINTFFWVLLWASMTIRLNRIEEKL
tara:strand:- start:369 stop:497 length:129 start_codon:yes stop_codon:yes gene_type:complete